MVVVSGIALYNLCHGAGAVLHFLWYFVFAVLESDPRTLLSSREVKSSQRNAYTKQCCSFGIA